MAGLVLACGRSCVVVLQSSEGDAPDMMASDVAVYVYVYLQCSASAAAPGNLRKLYRARCGYSARESSWDCCYACLVAWSSVGIAMSGQCAPPISSEILCLSLFIRHFPFVQTTCTSWLGHERRPITSASCERAYIFRIGSCQILLGFPPGGD